MYKYVIFAALDKFVVAAETYPDHSDVDIIASYCQSSPECSEIFQVLAAGTRRPTEVSWLTLNFILYVVCFYLKPYAPDNFIPDNRLRYYAFFCVPPSHLLPGSQRFWSSTVNSCNVICFKFDMHMLVMMKSWPSEVVVSNIWSIFISELKVYCAQCR